MSAMIVQIDGILARIEDLADQLGADPERSVHRAVLELREVFTDRRAIEPAFGRMRESIWMLRGGDVGQSASSLGSLDDLVERELLPQLRQVGFDV